MILISKNMQLGFLSFLLHLGQAGPAQDPPAGEIPKAPWLFCECVMLQLSWMRICEDLIPPSALNAMFFLASCCGCANLCTQVLLPLQVGKWLLLCQRQLALHQMCRPSLLKPGQLDVLLVVGFGHWHVVFAWCYLFVYVLSWSLGSFTGGRESVQEHTTSLTISCLYEIMIQLHVFAYLTCSWFVSRLRRHVHTVGSKELMDAWNNKEKRGLIQLTQFTYASTTLNCSMACSWRTCTITCTCKHNPKVSKWKQNWLKLAAWNMLMW